MVVSVGVAHGDAGAESPSPAASEPARVNAATGPRRLLFTAVMRPGLGLLVKHIEQGSPVTNMRRVGDSGTRITLEAGDIVTHVDGSRIDSLPTYFRLLETGRDTVVLTVIDTRTRRSVDYVVRPVGGRPREGRPPTGVARVLLVADTNDKTLGGHAARSLELLRSLFQSHVRHLDLEVVEGELCTAQGIIARLRALGKRAEPGDSLLVWCNAHGAYDAKRAYGDLSGGHYFAIQGGDLLRKTLFETLLEQPGKLKVLLSSSCNVAAAARPAELVFEERMMTIRGPTNIERLLHYHRGHLDMNEAARNQFGWSHHVFGSHLCKAFVELAPQHATWNPLTQLMIAETDAEYRLGREHAIERPPPEEMPYKQWWEWRRNQQHLTPVIFSQRLEAERVPGGSEPREIGMRVFRPIGESIEER